MTTTFDLPSPLSHRADARTRLVGRIPALRGSTRRGPNTRGVFLTDAEVGPGVRGRPSADARCVEIKDQLPSRRERVLVNVALKKIASETREFVNPGRRRRRRVRSWSGSHRRRARYSYPDTVSVRCSAFPEPQGWWRAAGVAEARACHRVRASPHRAGSSIGRTKVDTFSTSRLTSSRALTRQWSKLAAGGCRRWRHGREAPEGADTPEVVGWKIDE